MNVETKKNAVLLALPMAFMALAAAFATNLVGHQVSPKPIPLVDTNFLTLPPCDRLTRILSAPSADLSDFDCYACHVKGKPPTLHYDAEGKLIIPKEHSDIVMGHGRHDRNNNCFNCHNEN